MAQAWIKGIQSSKETHYVDNEKLYQALKDHHHRLALSKRAGLIKPRPSDFIGKCIIDICENLSHRWNFRNYSYREEFVQVGIANCTAAIDKFDPKRSENPYGLFSYIAWNSFGREILIEQQQSYIVHSNFLQTLALDRQSIEDDAVDARSVSATIDFSLDLVNKFQENQAKRRDKKKNSSSDTDKFKQQKRKNPSHKDRPTKTIDEAVEEFFVTDNKTGGGY